LVERRRLGHKTLVWWTEQLFEFREELGEFLPLAILRSHGGPAYGER